MIIDNFTEPITLRQAMKKFFLRFSALLSGIIFWSACSTSDDANLVSFVDPLIGSGGHGHVFIGANVPHGAIQAGPQNIYKGWDWCSGYHYSDSVIVGFAHTHLSGTGCADLGDVQIMPFTGTLRTSRGEQNDISNSCSSYYSHENEIVRPGYYSLLMDNGIREEMTATTRTAIHKITYPEGAEARLLVNLQEGNGDRAVDTYLKQIDECTFEGHRISKGWSRHHVYFTIKTDTPAESFAVFDGDTPAEGNSINCAGAKGVISFGKADNVMLKLSISSVSCENALENMQAEIPAWDFKKVMSDASSAWNETLNAIDIETQDETIRKIFYTSLYHCHIAPCTYCDINGEFRGHDQNIRKGEWLNYSVFSLWDTYRALHPLYTLIYREKLPDMITSMLSIYEQQGKLPIWPLVGSETNAMPGYSAVPIISDAILKNIEGFDTGKAYEYMKASTVYPQQNGIPYILEKGYIPTDKIAQATSIAMEYAVGDWGLGQVAKKLGQESDYKEYMKRGRYYEQYFDTSINFIRPKLDDGSWLSPYDPFESVHMTGHFCEGNGWQYTFFVPQHPEGLIQLMGGDEVFTAKLDEFFKAEGDMGEQASMDISGLIGMYAHGNEPSHHIAYMYAYAGEQWKTAAIVRKIMKEFYTDRPDGIIGNEDCGQMSAWYVLSAIGFYQVSPSGGVFVFGSPMLDKATINLPDNKTFTITALNDPANNPYIQSVKLNGADYEKSYITYDEIMSGGSLEFVMGPEPNEDFGKSMQNRPHTAI